MAKRKLKIFNHCWHIGHQHDLMNALKDVADFYWLRNYKRQYSESTRGPLPIKEWVNEYEPGKYDLAILHLDQQCFDAKDINVLGKGVLFHDLVQVITDIPIVVICHGTPYWPEQYPTEFPEGHELHGVSQALIDRMKAATKGKIMVLNSKTSAKQWGFGTPIWHGMDPKDWWDLPKEIRVVTMISPGGLDMYYDRQFLHTVKELLRDEGIELTQITVDWQAKNFDDYRNFLGRSLVYFNPTRESPMPRSRTEAMLSGCCVISTYSQDADMFIQHGKNGLLVRRDPRAAVEKIKWALNHYDKAIELGQAGKQTAIEIFNRDRYRDDWIKVLSESTGKEVTINGIEE